MDWILVSERLPEPETQALVAFKGGGVYSVDVGRKGEGFFIDDCWHLWTMATHWMPMPEPPRSPDASPTAGHGLRSATK